MRMNNLEAQNGVLDAFNRTSIPDKHLIESDQISRSVKFFVLIYTSLLFSPQRTLLDTNSSFS